MKSMIHERLCTRNARNVLPRWLLHPHKTKACLTQSPMSSDNCCNGEASFITQHPPVPRKRLISPPLLCSPQVFLQPPPARSPSAPMVPTLSSAPSAAIRSRLLTPVSLRRRSPPRSARSGARSLMPRSRCTRIRHSRTSIRQN
jgi:hypothetical protein